jgi:hypothetical protein
MLAMASQMTHGKNKPTSYREPVFDDITPPSASPCEILPEDEESMRKFYNNLYYAQLKNAALNHQKLVDKHNLGEGHAQSQGSYSQGQGTYDPLESSQKRLRTTQAKEQHMCLNKGNFEQILANDPPSGSHVNRSNCPCMIDASTMTEAFFIVLKLYACKQKLFSS